MSGAERVDVLAVMHLCAEELGKPDGLRLAEARDAVRELIEAATEHRNSYRDFPPAGSAMKPEIDKAAARITAGWSRLDAALARVQGGEA